MTVTYPLRCPKRQHNGRMCMQPAGAGTGHKGAGVCYWHLGSTSRIEETWRRAMEAAEELDVTPHEALLGFVRQAAGRAAYVDLIIQDQLRKHVDDGGDALDPPESLEKWLRHSRMERGLAAKTAKAAVDAGVMVALERRLDLEGSLVADALTAALDVLGLSPDQRMTAMGAAQQRLLAVGPGEMSDDDGA
jgi:hypothetical protein